MSVQEVLCLEIAEPDGLGCMRLSIHIHCFEVFEEDSLIIFSHLYNTAHHYARGQIVEGHR